MKLEERADAKSRAKFIHDTQADLIEAQAETITRLEAKLKMAVGMLEKEESVWKSEVASEALSGNIVKANYAKGFLNGIQVALTKLNEGEEK